MQKAQCGIFAEIRLELASPRLSTLLYKPLMFLEMISYSLPFSQTNLLLTAINPLYGLLNLWLIMFLALLLTFAVTVGSYYGVEVPAIALGKYLARSLALMRGAASKVQTRGSGV